MRSLSLRSVALTCTFVLFASSGFAQQPSEAAAIRAEVTRLRQQLDALEARLAALEGGAPAAAPAPAPSNQVAVPEGAAGAGGPTGVLPVYGMAGGAVSGAKVFNPDMAVIGDFLGAGGSNKVAPTPALEMHESEAAFQAVVDPYARADFFISFGEEGVGLEEGYVTFTSLPGGLLTKVGKMRAAFGKVNTLHNHVLPWADRPLVTNNLVGGEDGIDDTLRWRPLQRSIYHSFVGRTEWIWSHRDQLTGLQRGNGMYLSGDYQFARRWFAGARYDRSDHADDASLLDTGGSFVLTYWPSEFSQVRGQYRRTNYALGQSANELLFQFQFSIGAHGAHPF